MSMNKEPIEGIFDGDSDLRIYFRDIANSGGFSQEIEAELAERIRNGDEEALKQLVEKNLLFVVNVAKGYMHKGLPLGDLIGAGNLGLITATKRFDGTKGFKFISYAVWWIRQAILQALAENSRIVRLPVNKIGLLVNLNKIESRLVQSLGREPTKEEILLEESELKTVGEIQDLRTISQRPLHLDDEMDEEGGTSFIDTFADSGLLADEGLENSERLEILLYAIRVCLDAREEYILKHYYPLDGTNPKTLEQIGRNLGLTRERVRQLLREKALPKLRRYFAANNIMAS